MRERLVELVPNLSEGRDLARITELLDRLGALADCLVLDRHTDPDHHRTVVTLAADPGAVPAVAKACWGWAAEAIDLRAHRGVHPRIGAVDVFPIIPLRGVDLSRCADLSREVADRVAGTFQVPVYLYAESAATPARRSVGRLRRGEFEGLGERLRDPAWRPDAGPARPHPRLGASMVGARFFLLAFNVVLDTSDLAAAGAVARRVRESGGGLPGLMAIARRLAGPGITQVCCNLTDFRVTSLQAAHAAVAAAARARGIGVGETEIVGLLPEAAVFPDATAVLGLARPVEEKILERRLAAAGW